MHIPYILSGENCMKLSVREDTKVFGKKKRNSPMSKQFFLQIQISKILNF